MDLKRHATEKPMKRTRRNLVAAGVLLATAFAANLATMKSASAKTKTKPGPSCFMRGTNIRTADGSCKIEELAIGDLLPTFFGGIRPVQAVQRYRYTRRVAGEPWPREVRPVRIARLAFGPDAPRADLYLTQRHAIFLDRVLVPIVELINGSTITLEAADELNELEFFHIKLDAHDVIYAEGMECETLLNADESIGAVSADHSVGGIVAVDVGRCAPLLAYDRRARLTSRIRSAVSPWIDRRQTLDLIRDRVEERGEMLRSSLAAAKAP